MSSIHAEKLMEIAKRVSDEDAHWLIGAASLLDAQMADSIFIPCPNCDGSGEIVRGRQYEEEAEMCPDCHGTGKVEHEGEPITLEDLD